MWPDIGDPAAVRFLAAWEPPPDLERLFPNLQLLFSVGAGVDQFDFAALPAKLPVVRMVEPGIVNAMVEYVCCAVLGLHRDLPVYLRQQRDEDWRVLRVVPASRRRVGVLGGCWASCAHSCAASVSPAGLEPRATRSGHPLPRADDSAFLAGTTSGLPAPLTHATRGMLNTKLFAALPHGAGLVHVGRGPQLEAPDLLAALASGQIGHAILDVCDPEPLPPGHGFWQHPRVWLTPHIASMTQPESAVEVVLENLRRFEQGEPLLGQVDRVRGY
jgi:glyoxylate/hydroxypyruvate reductase A